MAKSSEVRTLHPGQRSAGGDACATPWAPLKFKHAFIETANERQAQTMLENVKLAAGEGRFGVIWSRAGWGKSRFAAALAARLRAPYLEMLPIWRKGSERGFLRALLLELKSCLGQTYDPRRLTPEQAKEMAVGKGLPHSINNCYFAVIDQLLMRPAAERLVFLDEMDRVPERLDLVRSLANLTGCGFILLGEEGMPGLMQRDGRVWSRTLDLVHFQAAEAPSIIAYGWTAAGLKIDPAAAALMAQAEEGGDWRRIKARTIKLLALANSHKSAAVSLEMARLILEEEQRSRRQ